MAEAKKPAKTGKPIMDVAHPDKSAPAQNSRATIVPSRPILKDPMMTPDNGEEASDQEAKPRISTSAGVKVQPLTAPALEKDDKPVEKPAEPKKSEPEPVEATEEPPVSPVAELEPEAEDADTEKKDDPQVDLEKQAADEDAEQAKHDAAIQKLVESKKYFVAVNSVEKRRSKRNIILGILLSLILAAAWVDIALDASLIQIDNIKPVTHFFSN